jgi:sugar lactone lactonase YvrE
MTAARMLAVLVGSILVVAAPAGARPFPDVLPLPTGFQPEGIDIRGRSFYVGSIPTGAVYRGDLRTGSGSVLVPAQAGRAAIGLDVDGRGRIFVAGGPTGQAYVYDARTGASLASYQLAAGMDTFVNDVVVTKDAAWFTESRQAVLYRVPLGRNGSLPAQADVKIVPLGGDFELAPDFNVNGIDAPRDGQTLVIVQSNLGRLYTVDPESGEADLVELSGGDVRFGDGILLDGRTLYVVQNRLNQVAVVRLEPDLASGTIIRHLTDPALDVPTTIAEFGTWLYAVNARFGTPDPGTAAYGVVRLEK